MGQLLVIADTHGELPRMAAGMCCEQLFDFGIPAAKDHQLDRVLQQFVKHLEDEVHPFLLDQAADMGEQQRIRIHGQTDFAQQRGFVARLAVQGIAVVGLPDGRVARRVPYFAVDAVQYAGQAAGSVLQQPRESIAELR